MNAFRFLLCLSLFFSSTLHAETTIQPVSGAERVPVRRELLGVNQLHYGKDSYGFLLPGTKWVNPEMVAMLREIGVKSMRYPGGCGGTHNYDWQRSAGLKGSYSGLGLMEFLRVCEEIGAEPMLGISAFRGSPEEAAAFVEFLNAPNDGRHPWAVERARLGHPEPFGVRYIEYGNETYHGNHYVQPNTQVLASAYAQNYLKFRAAMKKVDPNIALGVVLGPGHWNRDVFRGIGNDFDFGIVHHYQRVRQTDRLEYAQNFAVWEGLQKEKERALAYCPAEKRDSVRLALTEFNTTFAEHKHLTSALVNAEALFYLCQDASFFSAQYWQFVNEGFGMVRGASGNFVKRPNALMFALFSRSLLDDVVPLEVSGRKTPTAAAVESVEKTDDRQVPDSEDFQKNLFQNRVWKNHDRPNRSVMEKSPDDVLTVHFVTDEPYNYYHVAAWTSTPPWKSVVYRLTAEIRTEGMEQTAGGALELGDGRGFSKTHSVAATESILSDEWTPVTVDYFPLPDTRSLELKVRRFSGGGKGRIQIRKIRVVPVLFEPKAKPVISALGTVSRDESRWAVLLVNRSFEPETTTFTVRSKVTRVEAEALTADAPFATNEESPDAVRIVPLDATFSGNTVRVVVPPFSLVGVRGE
ncbi:MAG: hypothetical protein Q4D98_13470 [Planctomycetia bacterium]|nr:hypothetical protein [Planctomycetia bacterium]